MQLFLPIARAFINVFGITQPTPAQEKQAAWFIGTLLILVLLAFIAVGYIFIVHAR